MWNKFTAGLQSPKNNLVFGSNTSQKFSHEYLRIMKTGRLRLLLSGVHSHACNSRKMILLATTSSLYFSSSCFRIVALPDISRSSSPQCQSGLEPREFKSRSRASEKSPLVFSRALVTLTKSWKTNGEIVPHFVEVN